MVVVEQLANTPVPNSLKVPVDNSLHDEPILTLQQTNAHPLANSEWYGDIINCLTQQQYPAKASDKIKLHVRASARQYFLVEDILYKRSFDVILLRCVNLEETDQTHRECHSGICGGHFRGQSIAQRTLRMRYYWPTLFKDAHAYVQRCHQYQEHANVIHQPSDVLHVVVSPWPFSNVDWILLEPLLHPPRPNTNLS